MASKIKVDTLETADGTGSIALSNQLSGMTVASLPPEATAAASLTGALPALDGSALTNMAAGGKVLQVVSVNFTGHVSTTSNSATPTSTDGYGLFAQSFTPQSASSKILITTSTVGIYTRTGSTSGQNLAWLGAWYDTTEIGISSHMWRYNAFGGGVTDAASILALNYSVSSWGTTAKTINIRAGMNGTTEEANINGNTGFNLAASQSLIGLTIMEIGA